MTEPSRIPSRQARLRRVKGAGALAALLGLAAYLVYAAATQHIKLIMGTLTLRTGDYLWKWPLTPRVVLAVLGGAACLALAARPARPRPPARLWMRLGAAWLALFATGLLVLMQLLELNSLEPVFVALLAAFSALGAWLLAGPHGAADRLAGGLSRVGGSRWLPWGAALGGAAVMLLSWRVVFLGQPVVTDSQSQIAQALLLLKGAWRLEISQPLRDVICFPYAIKTVPSYSQYPPGYILPLAGALALRLPAQALDILSAALIAALTAVLARRVAGRAAAPAAALLLLGSPFFVCLSGSGMNHAFVAALLAGAALCFIPAGPARAAAARRRLALLGGFCLGWAVMTRPVTGLSHALVWSGAWGALLLGTLARRRRGQPVRPDRTPRALLGQLLWAGAGMVLPAALFLYYNFHTTGHPLVMGYQVSNPELHRLGFHGGRMPFTPAQALHRVVANCLSLNFNLFGWAVGSWVVAVAWWRRTRLGRGERVLLALILTQAGLYAIYQFHDLFLGPRFLFELLPAAAVLGAAGLATWLRRRDGRAGLLWVVLVLLALGGLADGTQHWQGELDKVTRRHEALEDWVKAQPPSRGLTVIVVRDEEEGEMVGRWFDPGRVWFVVAKHEAAARALPELQGARWLHY